MKRNGKIFKQAAALILAAFLCFVQAGCGCNQAMEESSSSPGVGPSAGAAAGETDNEPATSSTDGINQMTTPEYGTTTANGADSNGNGTEPNTPANGAENNAENATGNGTGDAAGNNTEDITHSAGAVGGGTAEGENDAMQEGSNPAGTGTNAIESTSIE